MVIKYKCNKYFIQNNKYDYVYYIKNLRFTIDNSKSYASKRNILSNVLRCRIFFPFGGR